MNIGLFLLRIVVGLTLAAHGTQKLFGWFGGPGLEGTGQWLASIGFQPGRRHALMSGLVETVGGVLFALGLVTPVASALILSVMLVAAVSAHVKQGFFLAAGGYEYNLVLGAAAVAVAFTGAGALSIDALIGDPFTGEVWGLGALAVAVVGAASQLAQRHQAGAPQAAAAH